MPLTPLPRIATYRPTITWGSGTGIDTSEFDDVSQWYLNQPGLQVSGIGREQVRAFAPPAAPSFDLTLSNHDGRFSPGGPLALFLGRGPAVTLDKLWGTEVFGDDEEVTGDAVDQLGDGIATKRMFTGTSFDMPQQISRDQRTVSVTALGTMASLNTVRPTTTLYENIRTDEAVAVILDAVDWPADKRSLDTGDTTLLYWWLNGQTTGMVALNALLAAEGAGAAAWEDGDGVFHFEGRQFRSDNERSTTVQWAFFDGDLSGNALGDSATVTGDAEDVLGDGETGTALMHIIPAEYTSNPDEVVVSVAATINTRVPTAAQKVWEYGGALVLDSAEVRDIEVAASDPFKDAIVPRDGTDYTISAGNPLSGISLLSTSGQTVTLRLTAPVGGCTVIGVVSNGIQVRAVSLPVVSAQTVTSTINTALAAARAGDPNNPLVLGCWPEIERNQTLDLVNSMALRYQRERRQITFRFANIDAIHQFAMYDLRPSDRVQFVHTHAELNMLLWVETIDYDVSPGGGLEVVTVGCEQVFDLVGGRFDSAQFDVDVFGV
jgi:hypothetical protein